MSAPLNSDRSQFSPQHRARLLEAADVLEPWCRPDSPAALDPSSGLAPITVETGSYYLVVRAAEFWLDRRHSLVRECPHGYDPCAFQHGWSRATYDPALAVKLEFEAMRLRSRRSSRHTMRFLNASYVVVRFSFDRIRVADLRRDLTSGMTSGHLRATANDLLLEGTHQAPANWVRVRSTQYPGYAALGILRPRLSGRLQTIPHLELIAWSAPTNDLYRRGRISSDECGSPAEFWKPRSRWRMPRPKLEPALDACGTDEPEADGQAKASNWTSGELRRWISELRHWIELILVLTALALGKVTGLLPL